MTALTLPARFVRDWLDSAEGEFFEVGAVSVLRETDRRITIEATPAALRDLRARAQCYVEETFDEPYLRGLQASARAVLRHLAESEVVDQ